MKKLISLILIFCMAVMLVPALAESADITGEWIADYSGYAVVLMLNADATFSMEVAGMGGAEGTWTLEGEALSLTAQGQTIVYDVKDGKISATQGDETLEFTRAGAEEAAPAEEKTVEITFADVNPDAAAEDFNGEWCIRYVVTGDEVAASESGEITADIAIKDGGITFGSGFKLSKFIGDKALKMEYADGAFTYSRSILGLIDFSFRVEMLQDGMAAVTMSIDEESFILYMTKVGASAEEPAA